MSSSASARISNNAASTLASAATTAPAITATPLAAIVTALAVSGTTLFNRLGHLQVVRQEILQLQGNRRQKSGAQGLSLEVFQVEVAEHFVIAELSPAL